MNLILTLFAAFVTLAIANPIGDAAALDARDNLPRTCQIFGLVCTAPADGTFCEDLGFQCQGKGKAPLISDATCAANCICPC
ncbi:hypothetical protein DFH09DRAFT_1200417 [Mycena vulgaris]|nr:hypothetical protein DFH09DRAFT_1200417 [Mycena vulgaris]